jgi:2-keto-4-pentenoate hydratase
MHAFTIQLLDAIAHGTTVARATASLPQTSAESQSVQAELIGALGGVGGWKVSPWSPGATLSAAPMPASWVHRSGDALDLSGLRFEVEFALVSTADGSFMIAPALELMRSRLEAGADWPDHAKTADLLVTAGLVLGTPQPLPSQGELICEIELVAGTERKSATTSLSIEALVEAAKWTADYAQRIGLVFPAGTPVITGARMGPLEFAADHIRAEITGFGAVEVADAAGGSGSR